MRINPINNNNNNIYFQGSIDKSFTNYLDRVRRDVVTTSRYDRNFSTETIKKTKNLIDNIMQRVTAFMAKTSEDTILCLVPTREDEFGEVAGELRFKDKKTNAQISASYFHHKATEDGSAKVFTPWVTWPEITVVPRQNFDILRAFKVRGKFENIADLIHVNSWSEELVKQAEPIDVDLALKEKLNPKNKSEKPLSEITEREQAINELKALKI